MGKATPLHASARLSAAAAAARLSAAAAAARAAALNAPRAWFVSCLLAAVPLGAAQAQVSAPRAASGAAQPAAGPAAAPGGAARAPARPTVGCLIGPEAVADIGTAVTGVVASVSVDRGDSVRSGQVLVQLESEVEKSNFEAARSRATQDTDIRAAESNLALAQQRHARAVGLVKEGFASPQTLEQAKTERDVAEQKLLQAQAQKVINHHEWSLVKAQLGLRTLKSPFNGVVVERFVSPGERAEDKPLLRLAMLDPLRVELVMPASRWGSVAPGDAVALSPELPQASTVLARVTHIDKMIDAASNTFRVRLSLPNPGNRLPAGARCRVEGAAAHQAAAPLPATVPANAPANAPATPVQPVAWPSRTGATRALPQPGT